MIAVKVVYRMNSVNEWIQFLPKCNGSNSGYHTGHSSLPAAGSREILGGVDRKEGGGTKPQLDPQHSSLRFAQCKLTAQPLTSASSILQFGIVHYVLFVFLSGNSRRFPKLCVSASHPFLISYDAFFHPSSPSSEKECPSGPYGSVVQPRRALSPRVLCS